ncbi:MAG TPA: hypothetical protein VI216_07520 [Candidatus Acidoferrales bacterium]
MNGSEMQTEPVAPPVPEKAEKAEQAESADFVIGILSDLPPQSITQLCGALRTIPGAPKILILAAQAVGDSVRNEVGGNSSSVSIASWPPLGADVAAGPLQSISAAYHSAFSIGERLGARACCVIASQVAIDPPRWVSEFAQPLLESQCDLVVPSYGHQKFQGLLNSGIMCPLTRSLYGKRIQNPLGPDLGVSQKLFQKITASNRASRNDAAITHPLISLTPAAACENLRISQAYFGSRTYPPPDWTNTSSILVQALGPVFLEMEKRAPCWQRVRGSVSIPAAGPRVAVSGDEATPDVARMIESFQLGVRDLQEIWGLVLPPATLLELRKLARLEAQQFRMGDELWARIVYDFALAHRLRTINRDHLLRSMAPLYLAWVASYANEVKTAGSAAVDQRLERLCLAYETTKAYLVSRWRWPDRFNP